MTAATTTGSGSEGEFAHRMIGIVNDGAIALLMSIGHRTGLFDVLADRPRCSAEEIAQRRSPPRRTSVSPTCASG
jgi:hypothetical protein